MYIVLRGADGDLEFEVVSHDRGATVGDLAAAIAASAIGGGSIVHIDGRHVEEDTELVRSGLLNGSVIELVRPGHETVCASGSGHQRATELVIVGGLQSGRRHPLNSPVLTIGRSRSADIQIAHPTISALHFRFVVDGAGVHLHDLGSHNGTIIDTAPVRATTLVRRGQLIRTGAVESVLRVAETDDRPLGLDSRGASRHGLVSFNRPPCIAPDPEPAEIPVPDGPATTDRTVAFSLATLIGPMLMAAIMVKVMGNLRYGVFALMSPVMLVANYMSARRRHAKDSKSSARKFKADLEEFDLQLDGAVSAERRRRDEQFPDLPEILRRSMLPSTRLWERRHSHGDYLHLRVGRGPVAWDPPVDAKRVEGAIELEVAVARSAVIDRCPVILDLSAGGVVGLVGDRAASLALARSLVAQACVLHGPADMGLIVLSDWRGAGAWDWTKWLPHCNAPAGDGRSLSDDSDASRDLMEHLLGRPSVDPQGPAVLLVVDDETLTAGRRSSTRAVLAGGAGRVAGLVMASSADRLPAVCDSVVHLRDDLGDAELHLPQQAQRTSRILVAGLTDAMARECARGLARLEDPEVDVGTGDLPSIVTLLAALGIDDVDSAQIADRWAKSGVNPHPSAPIGVGAEGIIELNLVTDGPHALVGGTTGSGKSELLRSLVAAMASRLSPQHLVFVLVDYKGGSAFDECARLPHTVGMVTDLDDHLGERALRSLEAELHHRERTLRSVGAADLDEYLDLGAPSGPMPRLIIVVDEFATLATELPDFIGALVGVAQRGRSLGVHMILATQRPSGVVDANIKANTNIRVALRVQGSQDSSDVIERPDAAGISRALPGRAYLRLGPGEVVAVQTVLSTGVSVAESSGRLTVQPFRFGSSTFSAEPVGSPASRETAEGTTDLARLVDACVEAFGGLASVNRPRRPWLEMLSGHLDLADLLDAVGPSVGDGIVLGLTDDPDKQAQPEMVWYPSFENLGFVGTVASGTTTAIISTALSAARSWSPDELHLYCLDFGGGSLAALGDLPHIGATVMANEDERQAGLISMLFDEVARRRSMTAPERVCEPQIILLVDGAPSFLAQFSGIDGQDTVDQFRRVVADGVGVGIATVLSADRTTSIPVSIMGAVSRRVLFRQVEPGDFAAIGVRTRDLPEFVPGRAIDSASRLVVQLAMAPDPARLAAAIATARPVPERPARAVASMPTAVSTAEVAAHLGVGDPIAIPVGIAEGDHSVASLPLYAGEHLFVGGTARSGVSTTLRAIARMLKRVDQSVVMVAVVGPRSPLWADKHLFDAIGTLSELEHVLDVAALGDGRQWVVIVDDAHLIDESRSLAAVARSIEHCRMVAGGRSDELHGHFNHWTRLVRKSGTGLLLQPRLDTDGDLLGVRLPRRVLVPLIPGRGFLVTHGQSSLVQVAGADLAVA